MTAGERLAASVADLTQTRLDNADDASDARCEAEIHALRAVGMLRHSTVGIHFAAAVSRSCREVA